jgi:hypothetical protein
VSDSMMFMQSVMKFGTLVLKLKGVHPEIRRHKYIMVSSWVNKFSLSKDNCHSKN